MAKRISTDAIKLEVKGLGPSYGDVAATLPNLCSWLCDASYDDGTPKGRSRLQMERRGDRVMVLLKDSDSGLCVEVGHENLTDAILTLELLLGHDDCPWVVDPYPLATPKRKRKN